MHSDDAVNSPSVAARREGTASPRWSVCVVSGSRADFGLLRPVMEAIRASEQLQLQVVITGVHCLPEVGTAAEVEQAFEVNARVIMQMPEDPPGRESDVAALARGIDGLNRAFARLQPDLVLVLGDRIEAFAAASAAAVGGRRLGHIHGGDRAEGVADESMRHAMTKLAHVHFPASEQSRERILRMGEDPGSVFLTGSPALDDLKTFPPLSDTEIEAIVGRDNEAAPYVVLFHPSGLPDDEEARAMRSILAAVDRRARQHDHPIIMVSPNRDPGWHGVEDAIRDFVASLDPASAPAFEPRPGSKRRVIFVDHVPRPTFIGLLRRSRVLIGNSSAGLIEAAAIGIPVVNVGPRQRGRERAGKVVDVESPWPPEVSDVTAALEAAERPEQVPPGVRIVREKMLRTPWGDGHAGEWIVSVITDLMANPPSTRKRNTW
ncbi:MAG: UDP-N-acetylglucosamine 2-epimerase [Planctomycetota bacterium]